METPVLDVLLQDEKAKHLVTDIPGVVLLKHIEKMTWTQIEEATGEDRYAFRGKYRSWMKRFPGEMERVCNELGVDFESRTPSIPATTGVTASDYMKLLDEEEILQRACAAWEKTEALERRKRNQVLAFEEGPVALAFVADLHIGDPGVNYPKMFEDAKMIAGTPGMYVVTLGDMVNNFIIGSLRNAHFNTALGICEQWVLLKHYLSFVADKLVVAVGGNHDGWTRLLTGIDYFGSVVERIRPDVLYDEHDCRVTMQVGNISWPGRMRHKWRGSSIYNPTHAIERAAKWDGDFVWGIGAHTHRCGVTREFRKGDSNEFYRDAIAAMCGTYKKNDEYARRMGFPMQNNSTVVTIVFDEFTRSMTGFGNLEAACDYMHTVYG